MRGLRGFHIHARRAYPWKSQVHVWYISVFSSPTVFANYLLRVLSIVRFVLDVRIFSSLAHKNTLSAVLRCLGQIY